MITQAVQLNEWEVRQPTCGSPLEGAGLNGNPTAQRLAASLTKNGQVEVLELARGLELRASSFVGRFALGNVMVTIRPKITGAPLMNLLRYAYRLRNLELFADVGYSTTQDSFADLLIHQLAAEASELLSRGLHREYLRTQSMLSSPRGRIDFNGLLRVVATSSGALPCVHYPRSEDTRLNQTLHGGLEFASRMTLDRELGGSVRRLAKAFASRITPMQLNAANLEEALLSLDRRTSVYQPALTLIKMLYQSHGTNLDEASYPLGAAGFLFDMNRFFQELLSRFLRENLEGFEVRDEQSMRGLFAYDPANNPRRRPPPRLRPDFFVLRKNRVVAVLDAKYRDLWEKPLPREMLYQLALYALGQELGKRRATILYPTLDARARQQVIFVSDPLHGTTTAEVILRPVNLLELDKLLRCKEMTGQRKLAEFAQHLAFGKPFENSEN